MDGKYRGIDEKTMGFFLRKRWELPRLTARIKTTTVGTGEMISRKNWIFLTEIVRHASLRLSHGTSELGKGCGDFVRGGI